jgi:SOS-response transcriptional repressor LexA
MFHNALMDSVWVRVVEELKRRGETAPQAWLATKLGLTEQAVANWKIRGIPRGRYMDIARVLGLSVEQLTSDGLPIKGGTVIPLAPVLGGGEPTLAYAGLQRGHTKVPVVGTAKLGEDGYYTELEHPVGHGDGFVEAYSSDANAYALKVKGDSMHPAIRHGQFVIVEPNGQCVPGENVLISLHDGRKLVKELVTERPDSITVISVNGGARITFDRVQVMFMHPVAGVMSASKWRPE